MFFRKAISRIRLLFPAALLLLLLAACSSDNPQSTFGPEGPVAARQLSLFWIIFWLAVVVFVIVEGALVYILIRFRRRRGQEGLPPQTHGNTALEIGWTIVPAIILIGIAVPTYLTIADQDSPPDGETLEVNVIAHQWWWEFEYPALGVVTANELHVPIETPVVTTLLSQDVIHSFWIPKLAGKTDVVPNNANTMWFVAPKPDTFFGLCAELCGVAHALMRFRVISQTQEDFDRWVEEQRGPPKKPEGELALKGQQLFGAKGCLVCHTVNGPEAPGVQQARMDGFLGGAALFPAPNLTTFATRTTFAGGTEQNNTDNLRKWVLDPYDVKPGNRMAQLATAYQDPTNPITDEEARALVAYLQSLEPDVGPPTPTPSPTATATPKPPDGTPPKATPTPPIGGSVLQIESVENQLLFNEESFTVRAGSEVMLTLVNKATSKALQHNWVLVQAGTEDSVATAGLVAGPDSDWIPKDDPNVIDYVRLLDGGDSDKVTFDAPQPGTYAFICTFPGHVGTMRGVFEVSE